MLRRKNVRIKQHDTTDCGAACLASVSAHYKLFMPIARIRQYASTDKKGTNILGMIEAANKLGFQARGVRVDFESLTNIPIPAIAHVIVNEILPHFMVIYDVNKEHVIVMDPEFGRIEKYSHDVFQTIWTGVLILMLPDEKFDEGDYRKSIVWRFWKLVRPHRLVLAEVLLGAILYTVLGLSTSIYIQRIIDNVLVGGNRNLLNLMTVAMLIILGLQIFIRSMQAMFALKTGQQIDRRLILGYYKHLLTLPQQFFDTMKVGEIISRVNDAVKIRVFINDTALSLMVNIFIIFFSFGMMFTYDRRLAVIMLSIIPFYLAIFYIVNGINRKGQRKLMENSAGLECQLVESITSMGAIKRFGLETFANLKTEVKFVKLISSIFNSNKAYLWTENAAELCSGLFIIILLWVGSGFVLDKSLTPGELISFYAIIGYFTGPASVLIESNTVIQNTLIAADRLFEIMDLGRSRLRIKTILRLIW